MFLALTALNDWWEKDAELLLVGPWCVPYDKRSDLAARRWQMLPSPWSDPERLDAASLYADAVYHRLLVHLAARLNRACGVEESPAYWRLLVGPWLIHFVHAAYDRHVHLSDALAQAPTLRTSVLAESAYRTPRTTGEAITWLTQDDHYNWQLFSELLAADDSVEKRSCAVAAGARSQASGRRISGAARYAGRARALVLRAMGSHGRAWMTDVTMPRASQLQLGVRSAFRIVPAPIADELSDLGAEPVMNERRRSVGDVPVQDAFEAACARMLPRHLPAIYLEGYDRARRTVRRRYPRPPSLLVSETGWYVNEAYKFLAAEALTRGARLVTVQHGAGYGLGRRVPLEGFETEIGHAFFVWGWAHGRPPLQNVPHPIVSAAARRRRRARPGTRMLFVLQSMERYLHRLGSTPAGSLWEPQWQWQDRFVAAVPGPLRRRMSLRPPPDDLGQGVQQRLCHQYPEVAVDEAADFKRSAAASRIVIADRLATCALESLAMNVPTVLFWDSRLWQFRDDVTPYLAALRQVGIVWDSPESAAAHVASVFDEPERWWQDADLQRARRAFVDRFALGRPDWVRSWVDALRRESALSTLSTHAPVPSRLREPDGGAHTERARG